MSWKRILTGIAFAIAGVSMALAQTVNSTDLDERLVRSRAVEAVIWAMPAVNYELMLREAFKAGAKENEIVYWSQPVDWHNQTLTPNPDAIYFMTFWNTKEAGPVVIEIPPAGDDGSLTANIDDLWQMALEDAGPSGADKGHGGKYLILPPGYADEVPDGYIVLRPGTYAGYALLRSSLKSHAQADVDKSVAYGKRINVYPLAKADNPPATVFTDAKNVLFDSTIKYDLSFFTSLDRIIQSEPWLERDKAMIDQLKSIGIEQGKPFNPDADTKDILGQEPWKHTLGSTVSTKRYSHRIGGAAVGPYRPCPSSWKCHPTAMSTLTIILSMPGPSLTRSAISASNGSAPASST